MVAGHDVFAERGGEDPETLAQKFAREGWELTHAQIDRITGWQNIATRLGNPEAGLDPSILIDRSCQSTIDILPSLEEDPARPEDVRKVDANAETGEGGDDAADMLRYGAMEAPAAPVIVLPRGALAGVGARGWSPKR